jgi:hypothetical protein
MIKESDWKKFAALKREALQRYCARVLDEVRTSIDRDDASPHERYLEIFQLIRDADKRLIRLFDDHSRSKAPMQFMMLRWSELVGPEDFDGFSADFLEHTAPPDDEV